MQIYIYFFIFLFFSLFRIAASVNNEAPSRWLNVTVAGGAAAAAAAAAAAEWFVHSYSPPVCQLLLDHGLASIVPGSVVLSKRRGDHH